MKRTLLVIIFLLCAISIASCTRNLDGPVSPDDTKASSSELLNIPIIIMFDTQGGSAINMQRVEKGGMIIPPNDPIKEGYVFIEWVLDEEKYDFTSPVYSNITLKAIYAEKGNAETLTVEFDTSGGSIVEPISVVKGRNIIQPIEPYKEGYLFEGWLLNGGLYDFEEPVTDNLYLKAKWSENTSINHPDDNSTSATTDTENTEISETSAENLGISDTESLSDVSSPTENTTNAVPEAEKFFHKLSDISGIWYLENSDVITLTIEEDLAIGINKVRIGGFQFCTDDGPVDYEYGSHFVGSGYVLDINNNGEFYDEKIVEESSDHIKLITHKKTYNFYRKANYPKHIDTPAQSLLRSINGFYWYLDGYQYSYIRPYNISRHAQSGESIEWESENVMLSENGVLSLENLDYSSYMEYSNAPYDLANKLNSLQGLIVYYDMKVIEDKLYMTAGDKCSTFTKSVTKKPYNMSISIDYASCVHNKETQTYLVVASIQPCNVVNSLTVISSDPSVITSFCETIHSPNGSGDFYINLDVVGSGSTNITVKETVSEKSITFPVTIE